LKSLIRATYELLGLRTYFTSGPKETRAWTIIAGMLAPQAAGVIHSDFERGFIRAETVAYQIDSFEKAMISAAVFGLLNALVRPLFVVFSFPFVLITFGLFMIVINAAIFGLAAWLVHGFRLRWGIWSALLGAIALGFINSLLYQVLGTLPSVR